MKKIYDLAKTLLWTPTDNTLIQFFRSLVVGVIATLVDVGIMALFFSLWGWNELLAAGLGFLGGLVTNYLISTFWVFRRSQWQDRRAEFGLFALVGLIGLLLTEGIIWLFGAPFYRAGLLEPMGVLSQPAYVYVGKMTATVTVFLWNFTARKVFIYR